MRRQDRRDPRPLEELYAVAEGIDAERSAELHEARRQTIELLCEHFGARKSFGEVLRYFVESGAIHHHVIADADEIGESFWVQAGRRTVERAIDFWKQRCILTTRPRHAENGHRLPPWAKLDWSSALQQLGVNLPVPSAQVPTTEDGGRGRPGDEAGPAGAEGNGQSTTARLPPQQQPAAGRYEVRFQRVPATGGQSAREAEPNVNRDNPNGGQNVIDVGPNVNERRLGPAAGGQTTELPGLYRSTDTALACARANCACSTVVTVVDDSLSHRSADWETIDSLASEVAAIVMPTVPWRNVAATTRRVFLSAAVLAETLFDRAWLLAAAHVTHQERAKVHNLVKYLIGCLRKNCFEMQGFRESDVTSSWFGALMKAAERPVDLYAPKPKLPAKVVKTADPDNETPLTLDDWSEEKFAAGGFAAIQERRRLARLQPQEAAT